MEAVSVTGVRRQSLLAADLGVEIASRPQMAKAGLTGLSRPACAWTVRTGLGGSGGCPAVAAVHQRISNGSSLNP